MVEYTRLFYEQDNCTALSKREGRQEKDCFSRVRRGRSRLTVPLFVPKDRCVHSQFRDCAKEFSACPMISRKKSRNFKYKICVQLDHPNKYLLHNTIYWTYTEKISLRLCAYATDSFISLLIYLKCVALNSRVTIFATFNGRCCKLPLIVLNFYRSVMLRGNNN